MVELVIILGLAPQSPAAPHKGAIFTSNLTKEQITECLPREDYVYHLVKGDHSEFGLDHLMPPIELNVSPLYLFVLLYCFSITSFRPRRFAYKVEQSEWMEEVMDADIFEL